MNKAALIQSLLASIASEKVAQSSRRFFRCDAKGYSNGTRFIGIAAPTLRKIAKEHFPLSLEEIHQLLISEIHEERLIALFFLNALFAKAPESHKEELVTFYIAHFPYIRDWDLVDSSAPYIVGKFLHKKDQTILARWACSEDYWVRRIAMVSHAMLIRSGDFASTLTIAKLLLQDQHDLIHKAVGWMLREMGKRNVPLLQAFLEEHAAEMPRTMLRYAIEKFSKEERDRYLQRKSLS